MVNNGSGQVSKFAGVEDDDDDDVDKPLRAEANYKMLEPVTGAALLAAATIYTILHGGMRSRLGIRMISGLPSGASGQIFSNAF